MSVSKGGNTHHVCYPSFETALRASSGRGLRVKARGAKAPIASTQPQLAHDLLDDRFLAGLDLDDQRLLVVARLFERGMIRERVPA